MGRGDRKGGESYWGANGFIEMECYLKFTPGGVEISLSAYNLVLVRLLSVIQIMKGVFSLSLILFQFPSVYWDDSCRQFRKCRPNVSVELGSLKFLPLSSFFTTLSDHNPPVKKLQAFRGVIARHLVAIAP